MKTVTTIEQLEAIYGTPAEAAMVKETGHITPEYARYIEASPFAMLATTGPGASIVRRAATSAVSCGWRTSAR